MTGDDAELGERIKHAVTCEDCGGETYMYERYCHLCGGDRWSK